MHDPSPCTYSSYLHSVSKPGYSCATCEVSFYQSRAAPRTAERARIGLASSPHPADSTPHRYIHVCMYVRDETDPWNGYTPPLSTSRFVTHLAWVCNYSRLLTNREGAKYTYLTKKLEVSKSSKAEYAATCHYR